MTIRLLATLVAAAAILGTAATARADNVQLLTLVIKWSAVMYQDAGALGSAVDKGPAQADRAALHVRLADEAYPIGPPAPRFTRITVLAGTSRVRMRRKQ